MPKKLFEEYVEVTMHQFKTHISHYVRMMEADMYKAIIVKRGRKPVGLFMLYPRPDREAAAYDDYDDDDEDEDWGG